jgi:hypothetical protein
MPLSSYSPDPALVHDARTILRLAAITEARAGTANPVLTTGQELFVRITGASALHMELGYRPELLTPLGLSWAAKTWPLNADPTAIASFSQQAVHEAIATAGIQGDQLDESTKASVLRSTTQDPVHRDFIEKAATDPVAAGVVTLAHALTPTPTHLDELFDGIGSKWEMSDGEMIRTPSGSEARVLAALTIVTSQLLIHSEAAPRQKQIAADPRRIRKFAKRVLVNSVVRDIATLSPDIDPALRGGLPETLRLLNKTDISDIDQVAQQAIQEARGHALYEVEQRRPNEDTPLALEAEARENLVTYAPQILELAAYYPEIARVIATQTGSYANQIEAATLAALATEAFALSPGQQLSGGELSQ